MVGDFPTTRWSVVLDARVDPAAHTRALDSLLASYWKPLYVYARHLGLAVADAEDAVQGLFARLIDREFLRALDPERGRMRHYLRAAMRNHLADAHAHAVAAKRGGRERAVTLDTAAAERTVIANPVETPEAAYERTWAAGLLELAFERLRGEYADGTRGGPFSLVERYFSLDAISSYDELAPSCGMTVAQLKSFLHRARVRFRELVSEEISHTVDGPAQLEEELGYLRTVLYRR